jgi:hypothetical protein
MSNTGTILPRLPFESDQFNEAWDEWISYRRERNLAAYKPIGLKNFFIKLVRESGNDETTAILMLKQSIENNWQGVFALKNLPNGQRQTVIDQRKHDLLSGLA